MPANGRRDLIRCLKVNLRTDLNVSDKVISSFKYHVTQACGESEIYFEDHIFWSKI